MSDQPFDARRDPSRFLNAIVETSDDAIVGKDANGIIQSWNAAAERLFGYRADQAVGRHISIIIPTDRLSEEDLIMSRLLAGERIERLETVRRRQDGGLVEVELTISPITDETGRVVAASKIARDVTARRAAEARERQLLAERAESNAKFRAFFEQGAQFATIMSLDGTVIEANRLSWEGCGFGREQVVHRPFWDGPWWNSAEVSDTIRRATELAARGGTFRGELPYVVAGGRERMADVMLLPIKDDAGQVVLLAGTGTDITDRTRTETALRDSEERFRTLADNMSQFTWMADAKGWIFWYNQRWFDYTGTTLEEMQGWGWRKVHHPDHVDRVVARIQHSWDTGIEWEDTFPLRGRDGQYRWFLSRALPIRDASGAIVRWFGTNTDITEHRQLEEELRSLSVELADTNRRKDEFLATLSHELRNPLAAVRTSLALFKVARGEKEVLEQAQSAMERQVTQIVRLLDDLLDVSRITRDRLALQVESLDLTRVIAQAVDACESTFAGAGVGLTVEVAEGPVHAKADAARLEQVVSNLLTNAAKFTLPGGRVRLTLDTEGDTAIITVTDTGIGIPSDMLGRIFEMFTQVDGHRAATKQGLGIGLSLVKRLVEMHGGTVTASSHGHHAGSTFIVRLPILAPAPEAPVPNDNTFSETTAPRRVLIVEDDPDNAESLALLLTSMGHETAIARDGAAALATAADFRPDAMLLDIGLPVMDGYETCRRLRAEPWGRDIFIAALTGWGQEEDRRRTREAGFDRHLVKPIDPAELASLLGGSSIHQAPD